MNPLRLRATNLRTFADLDLEIPSGCVVIGGENGAGKSTILNAIDIAIFCGRGELGPLLSLGEDELTLELEFAHAGDLYRVRRCYSARGRGKTTLDLECAATGEASDELWMPLTRETAEATQQHLEQLLGLSRATFRASSFLAQGDGAAFTEASPRDRKAILAEILGLDLWDRLLEHARRDLRTAEEEQSMIRGRVELVEEHAANLDAHQLALTDAKSAAVGAARQRVSAARAHEEARDRLAARQVLVERATAAAAAHRSAHEASERARGEYARARKTGIDRDLVRADIAKLEQVAGAVAMLEQGITDTREQLDRQKHRDRLVLEADQRQVALDRLIRQADKAAAAADEHEAKALHLDTHIEGAGDCDRCGQKLGAEAAARAAESFRHEAAGARTQAGQIREGADHERSAIAKLRADVEAITLPDVIPAIEPLEERLAEARAAVEQRAGLVERLSQLGETAGRVDELKSTFETAEGEAQRAAIVLDEAHAAIGDNRDLEQAVTAARRAVDVAESVVEQHRREVARLEAAVERATEAARALAELRIAITVSQARVDVLKLAERAYGRDGIPALIVENAAIPQLELEANRILGELAASTADCRIELRTQRALKTSETLRETLDIIIITPAGERPYETFSGGERTRLNLALRISLARLLAHRRGAESRLLAIDEPDGLDAQGMDALVAVLAGLSADFDRVLVVSHQPQLASSFDQAIVVVKDGDRSRIETPETVELAEVVAIR